MPRRKNEKLKKDKTDLETQLAAEKAAQQQSLCKLQTEFDLLKMERKGLEEVRASLEKKKRDLVDAMDATQKNTTIPAEQTRKSPGRCGSGSKGPRRQLEGSRPPTDELNQAVNEKELLRKRMAELAKDLAKAVKALEIGEMDCLWWKWHKRFIASRYRSQAEKRRHSEAQRRISRGHRVRTRFFAALKWPAWLRMTGLPVFLATTRNGRFLNPLVQTGIVASPSTRGSLLPEKSGCRINRSPNPLDFQAYASSG